MSESKKILDKYWDGLLPVNPDNIAHKMGIVISEYDCGSTYSGEAGISVNGLKYIKVKSFDLMIKRRFVIAHEIGHHTLFHINGVKEHVLRDIDDNFNLNVVDLRELEANRFAVEFLIPKQALEYAIGKGGYTSIMELASIFGVSQVAMKWRLSNLGIV